MKSFMTICNNNKHKGLKKSTGGMDFESYSGRLGDLNEFSKEYLKKPKKISNYKQIYADEIGQ